MFRTADVFFNKESITTDESIWPNEDLIYEELPVF
jgi:hypothetical protein